MEDQGVESYILDLRNNPVRLLDLHLTSQQVFSHPLVDFQGGLVTAGLDVAQIWLDGDETLVNTIDRDGNMLPISIVDSHALTHDPLVVLVSNSCPIDSVLYV